MGKGSTTLPGFIIPSGSQMALNSRNASISSGPNMLRQQLGFGLAVAVLARDRAATGDHQIGRLVEEGAHLFQAVAGAQAEIDAAMNAAVAEMTVERGVVAVLVKQPFQLGADRYPRRSGGTALSSKPSQASG